MDSPFKRITDQIITLNVGGTRFSTSSNTLNSIPDTFFTSLLSGRLQSVRDETGAIFIDRDPDVFRIILNYLRSKQIDISQINISTLKHEAQFFGLAPLVRRLTLCEELEVSACGSVYFHAMIKPPNLFFEKIEMSSKNKDKRSAESPSPRYCEHSKKSSYELNKHLKNELNALARKEEMRDQMKVRMLRSHNATLAVAYSHFICVYRESNGWSHLWTSPKMKSIVRHISINSKTSQSSTDRLLAVSFVDETVILYIIDDVGSSKKKGPFSIGAPIDSLFFVGSQLVGLSRSGKVGIWHSATQNWQVQDVAPITCHDTAGSSLLLGCTNGCLYYIDMQKFPLRMKDNDLLITELYKDPAEEGITAISVFLTPKTSFCGNWIEIAYGTENGTVRVIVQHPETVGHGPQLFQSYNVHTSAVNKISLTTGHLISVCSEYNHVRSWLVTRFRGMISTQPGTMSLASFKIMSLESTDESIDRQYIDPGPFGDQDSEQVFIQRLVPNANQVFVRLASTGERLCTIQSIDNAPISAFVVHECDGQSRIGNRPRRFLFCGSTNGSVQMWDLTTALDQFNSSKGVTPVTPQPMIAGSNSGQGDVMKPTMTMTTRLLPGASQGLGGPTAEELLRSIDDCDICCSSLSPTPCTTPYPEKLSLGNQ